MQEFLNIVIMFLLNPVGLSICGILVYKMKNHLLALPAAVILTAVVNEMILDATTYTNRTSDDFAIQLGFAFIQCLLVYCVIRMKWKLDKNSETDLYKNNES